MSHTFARIHIHLIFSTKERQKLIPQEMQSDLWSYMGGICHNKGIEPIAINGTDNHAHEQEFVAFLKRHRIKFDPRYIFG